MNAAQTGRRTVTLKFREDAVTVGGNTYIAWLLQLIQSCCSSAMFGVLRQHELLEPRALLARVSDGPVRGAGGTIRMSQLALGAQ